MQRRGFIATLGAIAAVVGAREASSQIEFERDCDDGRVEAFVAIRAHKEQWEWRIYRSGKLESRVLMKPNYIPVAQLGAALVKHGKYRLEDMCNVPIHWVDL